MGGLNKGLLTYKKINYTTFSYVNPIYQHPILLVKIPIAAKTLTGRLFFTNFFPRTDKSEFWL
ncbi:MAG: hypothetical protein EA409_01965 [Saprospirales bacterium]|nr:MAG: hypothetical protein EA409_01965 [Saprospirales bacterium]